MWWDPRTENESELRPVVDRLVGQFRDHASSSGGQLVWAVGSCPIDFGTWHPLVVVDSPTLGQDLLLFPGLRLPFEILRLSAPGNAVTQLLTDWDVPFDTIVDMGGPIAAAASVNPGSSVTDPASGLRATVGIPCRIGNSSTFNGFITAGHLVGSNNTMVEVQAIDPSGQGTIVQFSKRSAGQPCSK